MQATTRLCAVIAGGLFLATAHAQTPKAKTTPELARPASPAIAVQDAAKPQVVSRPQAVPKPQAATVPRGAVQPATAVRVAPADVSQPATQAQVPRTLDLPSAAASEQLAKPAVTAPGSKQLDVGRIRAPAENLNANINASDPAMERGSLAGVKERMLGIGQNSSDKLTEGKPGFQFMDGGMASKADRFNAEVGEKGPISGSRHGDTFAGEAINSRGQGGTDNFSGGGRGHAMDGGLDPRTNSDLAGMLREQMAISGVTPTGNWEKDLEELVVAMHLGDTYKEVKDMTREQRKAWAENRVQLQRLGADFRPRDDDTGSAGGPTELDVTTGLPTRFGAAGGAADGRGDQQPASGGGAGGGIIVLDKADGPERVTSTGTLNLDAVLAINAVVNPTRH